MLELNIPITNEGWDDEQQEFIPPVTVTVRLEHSLLSISKWESKWHIPYLGSQDKTDEQLFDYIGFMLLNEEDKKYLDFLSKENIYEIKKYLEDEQTATKIYEVGNGSSGGRNRTVTSELIYCWMAQAQIPFTCETWNVQRLLTLIRVYSIENDPDKKKMSKKTTAERYAEMNARRQAQTKAAKGQHV